jgi:hypothetical protein
MGRHTRITNRGRAAVIAATVGLLWAATPGLGQDRGGKRPVAGLAPAAQLDAHDRPALAAADPVDRHLADYARQLPEMGLLRLYGRRGVDLVRELPALLGEDARNADYEHDAHSRSTLIDLQMQRIETMVRDGLPSSTLFETGAGSTFDHPYLCVITLDTVPFLRDPAHATRLMLSGSAGYPHGGDDVELIGNEDFLRFTVDHEVFHCLDAYFNGPPMRRTHDALQSHYQGFVNEARADAFATRAFMRKQAPPGRFLMRFAAIRAVSLLDLDLQHWTGEVIRRAADARPEFGAPDLALQVEAGRALVAEIGPSADRYAGRLADAARLVESLGGDSGHLLLDIEGQRLPRPDDAGVAALLHEVRRAQDVLAAASLPDNRRSPARSPGVAPALLQADAPRVPLDIYYRARNRLE